MILYSKPVDSTNSGAVSISGTMFDLYEEDAFILVFMTAMKESYCEKNPDECKEDYYNEED